MIRVLLKRLAVFTLALCAGVLCSGSLHAASMNEVSCSGFTLSYDGPSATSRCYELDEEGNQTEVKIQRLVAKGASFEMVVTYSAAKFHTYFPISATPTIGRRNRNLVASTWLFSRVLPRRAISQPYVWRFPDTAASPPAPMNTMAVLAAGTLPRASIALSQVRPRS